MDLGYLRLEGLVGYLRLEGLVAQAPGARRPATAGVSHVLRGDLDSGASEHLAHRPGSKLLLLGLDVPADQQDGRAHTPQRQTRRPCSSGSRWLFTALGSLSQAP